MSALADVAPQAFLSPFLDIIRSQNTNGPITEAALAAVARFLNYGVIDAQRFLRYLMKTFVSSIKSAHAVESIAQAVTHTKFIGGANAGSDECVLFKILQVKVRFLCLLHFFRFYDHCFYLLLDLFFPTRQYAI